MRSQPFLYFCAELRILAMRENVRGAIALGNLERRRDQVLDLSPRVRDSWVPVVTTTADPPHHELATMTDGSTVAQRFSPGDGQTGLYCRRVRIRGKMSVPH